MENGLVSFSGIVLIISTMPLIAIYYGYYWSGTISFIILSFVSVTFFWIYLFKRCAPLLLKILSNISQKLSPITNYLNNTKVIGPIISWCVKTTFLPLYYLNNLLSVITFD